VDRVERLDVALPARDDRVRGADAREQEADDVAVERGHVARGDERVRMAAREERGVYPGERTRPGEAVGYRLDVEPGEAVRTVGRDDDLREERAEEADRARRDRLATDGGERLVAAAHPDGTAAGDDDARDGGARRGHARTQYRPPRSCQ